MEELKWNSVLNIESIIDNIAAFKGKVFIRIEMSSKTSLSLPDHLNCFAPSLNRLVIH